MPGISFRKENLSSGGLKDDFDGELKNLVFCPWNYSSYNTETGKLVPTDKQLDHFTLAVHQQVLADDGDVVNEFVSAGSLEDFWPSKDGITPVPLDKWDPLNDPLDMVSGPFVVKAPEGKREMLAESNFTGQWVDYMLKSGFPDNAYDSDLRAFQGVYGRWTRIDQAERKNLKKDAKRQQSDRAKQVLCMTEIKKKGAGAVKAASSRVAGAAAPAATATATAPAAAPAPATNGAPAPEANGGGNDFATAWNAAALAALRGAPNNTLTYAELGKATAKSFAAGEKIEALRYAASAELIAAASNDIAIDTAAETVRLLE